MDSLPLVLRARILVAAGLMIFACSSERDTQTDPARNRSDSVSSPLRASTPTAAAPRPLDDEIIPSVLTDGSELTAEITCGSTSCYAVWTAGTPFSGVFALLGIRVGLDGVPLDQTATVLSLPPAGQGFGAVHVGASDQGFCVVWYEGTVRALRVRAADGALLDGVGGFGLPTPSWSGSLSVASDRNDFAIGWSASDQAGHDSVRVTRIVGNSGTVLDPAGIAIADVTDRIGDVAISFDGTRYAVAWAEGPFARASSIRGARVTPSGSMVDGPPSSGGISLAVVSGLEYVSAPHLIGSSSAYLACWTHNVDSVTSQGECRRYALNDLTSLDPAAAPYSAGTSDTQVASNGSLFMVTAGAATAPWPVVFRVRASDGARLADTLLPTSATPPAPRVAIAGTELLLAWTNIGAASGAHYVTSRVRPSDGTLEPPMETPLCRVSNSQRQPVVASDGANFYASWAEMRSNGVASTYGMPLDSSGRQRASAATLLATASTSVSPRTLAFGGGVYAISVARSGASQTQEIGAVLVRASDGVPLAAGAVWLGAGTSSPQSVACDATSCMVAWQATDSTCQASRIRISDSAVLDTITVYRTGAPPAVASDGTNFLVVTEKAGGIYAKRIRSSDGAMLDGAADGDGIVIADGGGGVPSAAFGDGRYLVAWQGTDQAIHAGRITPGGALLDGPATARGVVLAQAVGLMTRVTFDGRAFVVTTGLRAMRMTGDGVLLDPPSSANGFALTGGEPMANGGDVAGAPQTHRFLAVYETYSLTTPLFGYRAIGHLFGEEIGPPCSATTDCTTGFCVDGVCCDSACGGGAPDDCQACSVAAGAAADGTCAPIAAGKTCRAASGVCRLDAACDGTTTTCPASAPAPNGTPCPGGSCVGGTCNVPDAGTSDAGASSDAQSDAGSGAPDADVVDAATLAEGGARSEPDASQDDAGAGLADASVDVRVDDAGEGSVADGAGCDCHVVRSRDSIGDGIFFVVAVLLRRRSQRRGRPAPLRCTSRRCTS
jgi:hypothetical protein